MSYPYLNLHVHVDRDPHFRARLCADCGLVATMSVCIFSVDAVVVAMMAAIVCGLNYSSENRFEADVCRH